MHKVQENLERHMTELCLRIGSRHIGSPGEAAAANYIEQTFREYGYPTFRESYPVTGWDFKSFEFYNLTRKRAVPAATACFFSNAVEVEGKLLWLKHKDLDRLAECSVSGRVCMLECWSGESHVKGRNQIAEKLDSLGAAAAIFISTNHTALAPSTKIQRSPFLQQLGTLAVSEEGAYDLAAHKDDLYRIAINAKCFPHNSSNIIARRDGTGGKGVLGAHYDTAPLIQGAYDNASGVAIILEIARLLKNRKPGVALDFVAFGAEEYVTDKLNLGSGDYLERHGNDDLRWYVNFDGFGLLIGEPYIKISYPGYPEKTAGLQQVGIPISYAGANGDGLVFYNAGIPTIAYCEKSPFNQLHTAKDSLDIIDYEKMALGVMYAVELFKQLEKL